MRWHLILAAFIANCTWASDGAELDKLVLQWTQLEQQHSEINNRWLETKPLLALQLELLKAEEIQLKEALGSHVSVRDDVEKKRFDLLQQQTELEGLQDDMSKALTKIGNMIITIHKQLPPPLREKWQPDITRLTQPNSELTDNSERLDTFLMLLNQLEQFEQRVALNQTTMQVAANASSDIEVQVDQVYLGLSQAWYISKNAEYWGIGRSTAEGWQWQHQPEEVDVQVLRQTVQMLNEPSLADLVALPIRLGVVQ